MADNGKAQKEDENNECITEWALVKDD